MIRSKSSRGFTLLELMITVVILAILSVVATVGYKGYVHKARTTEAVSFLATIKMKQVTYFQTYGQYVDTSTAESTFTDSDFYPSLSASGANNDLQMNWGIECPDDKSQYPGWCALGARPTGGKTYFHYVTVGWSPDDANPPAAYIKDNTKRWWYAEARADQNQDGLHWSTFILTSEIVEPWIFNESE
jgi:prepilin-type N-terminal cleavage/methylation domain-containing protein